MNEKKKKTHSRVSFDPTTTELGNLHATTAPKV